jgi:hypothetical protein
MPNFEVSGKAAREKAQKEYDAGWNLRPAQGVPGEVVEALRAEAALLPAVKALTLADARDDDGGPTRVVVGVRVDPKGPTRFEEAVARLRAAVDTVPKPKLALFFLPLDDEVDTTMVDESPNPYVIFVRGP